MRRAYKYRLRLLSGGIAFVSLFLVVRLYFVQIVHGADYSLRAEHQYVSSSEELFSRGSIYFTTKDKTEVSAATLATGFLIAIDPERVKNPEDAYAAILKFVPELNHDAFMLSAAKKGDPYEVVAHHVSDEAGRAVDALEIPGVQVERERWRDYPSGNAAQSVGIIAFDNDNTLAGRLGLERYYDDILAHGSEGVFGNFFAELFGNLTQIVSDPRTAQQGDVVTSIEPVVQKELNSELAKVQAQYGSAQTGGIIMDPETGAIYALDTAPSFDPNHFQQEDAQYFGNPLVEKRYEFGSIFKTMTMTAGLDAGVVTADSTYNDTGCIEVNKKRICNYDLKARGVIPMQQILSQSLNVGASYIATRLGHERFRDYYVRLGLGTETGIDLPSEIHGDIQNIMNSPRDVEYDTASFGQGIATTPIETIRALSSIANDGKIVTPHLATAIRLESGVTKKLSWGQPVQVFNPAAAHEVTNMLVKVVDTKLGNGTVKIPGMSVAAKTGTAQIAGSDGKYIGGGVFFHSFFGYFPASDPKFVILLYTVKPQGVEYASETLTKPFMNLTHFLINYYDLPPDRGPGAQ